MVKAKKELGFVPHISFKKLADEMMVKNRQPGRQPIFQVMFILLEESFGNLRLQNVEGELLYVHTGTSKNDLTLDVQASGDEWTCRFEYATDLFSSQAAAKMADHFTELLHSIVKVPDESIGRLNLMPIDERNRLLVDGNGPLHSFAPSTVPALFESQVLRTPRGVAIVCDQESVTFTDLNSRANRLAHHLIKLGVGPETLVGICMDRSVEMVVALLATLKAGGAYLPLDPQYPPSRLQQMLDDARPVAILTISKLVDRLPTAQTLVRLDSQETSVSIAHCANHNPDDSERNGSLQAGHPAYCIYTSGSTGVPKGTLIEHSSLIAFFDAMQCVVPFSPGDRHAAITTIGFDISVLELFQTMCHGATVVLATDGQAHDPAQLAELIRSTGATSLQATPSFWSVLVDRRPDCLRNLTVMTGGEALSRDLARRLHAVARRVWNLYGPTEATIWASAHLVGPVDLSDEAPQTVVIGRPLSNYRMYVLDPQRELVTVGGIGELYIAGAGLARGYLNRMELTAERFVADPFATEPDQRMYRTGDLARWRQNGTIEFLGRSDHQVKIRGFRIELGEIEAALLKISDVAEAAVISRNDTSGDAALVAYLVMKPNRSLDEPQVRKELATFLPGYMIPAAFVVLEKLPLTPNGKLDRKGLPASERRQVPNSLESLPQTDTERKLERIWANMLKIDRIGVHDNFFEFGGHSLLALRVIDEVNQTFERALKVADLFAYPTIAEFSDCLTESGESEASLMAQKYLESIHSGAGQINLVIVGPNLRVSRNELPPEFSVWWLKLDGLHVWPHQHWDIPTQAAVYLEEIRAAIPFGKILLCGHSIGGLLAIEIAHQLRQVTDQRVDLILLEPSPAWKTQESLGDRLVRHARAFFQPGRVGRIQHLIKTISKKSERKILQLRVRMHKSSAMSMPIDDRWKYMAPYYARLIRGYQLPESLDNDLHVFGTSKYLASAMPPLRHLAGGRVTVHEVPDELSHLDLGKSQNNHFWISIVRQVISGHSSA